MAKILLDYVFPISVITPTAQASTAFLKQACLVVKPKAGQEANVGKVYMCTTPAQVADYTDNENATQLFAAGMDRVYILLADDLDLADALEENLNLFYTVLISDDFTDADIEEGIIEHAVSAQAKVQDITYVAANAGTAGNAITVQYISGGTKGSEVVNVAGTDITVEIEDGVTTATDIQVAWLASPAAMALAIPTIDEGDEDDTQEIMGAATSLAGGADAITGAGAFNTGLFKGVVGFSTTDYNTASEWAVKENFSVFLTNAENGAKNMCFAFGKLLSNLLNWNNQQFINMPFNDGIDDLGEANLNFDSKISFVIHDDEFANRLALFAVGGKAIVAPYIVKNLCIDIQSRALQWISGNQPKYTLKEAALLELRLQEDVMNSYIERNWVDAGTVEIRLEQQNFVASGYMDIAEPNALWRVVSELRQTL